MGGGNSTEAEDLQEKQFKLPPDLRLDKSCKKAVRKMKLKKRELAKLWEVYKQINDVFDKDEDELDDDTIDLDELCEFLNKEEDTFMENFFELMDSDEDGVWEFGEFLRACNKFLCGTQEMLIELCFRIFDNDKDGYLDGEELQEFVEMCHGPTTIYPLEYEAVLRLYDSKRDGMIDFLEFEEAAKNYPLILWKIQDLKAVFEKKICGHDFWVPLFTRVHPDHLDDFYDKWKAGLSENFAIAKSVGINSYKGVKRISACFCPCLCGLSEDSLPLMDENGSKRKVQPISDDIFPDALTLEHRLNLEADEDYEPSDEEEFKKYITGKEEEDSDLENMTIDF